MECLDIEIYKHFKNPHSYIIWNKKKILGDAIEDGIIQILNKDQLVDFYFSGKTKFKIERWKIEKYITIDDK
jgi:hypothetical protein